MIKQYLLIGVIVLLAMFSYTTFSPSAYAQESDLGSAVDNDGKEVPCEEGDIKLNTNIPFIGRCIKKDATASSNITTMGSAFPRLMGGLMRVVMTAVIIVGFLAILVGGFMIAADGAAKTKEKGMKLIKLAIAGLILVGLSGIILNLINPNFFRTDSSPAAPSDAGTPSADDIT